MAPEALLLLATAASAPAVCPPGMVALRGGAFVMKGTGAAAGDPPPLPSRRVKVAAFCLDRTEVAAAAYDACTTCTPRRAADACPGPEAGAPAVCVDVEQAAAYCRTRGARLPSEAEWMLAATGGGRRDYVWGVAPRAYDPIRPNLCLGRQMRTGSLGPCPAGASRDDRTPQGVLDLAYDAAEWVRAGDGTPVARGGSWASDGVAPIAGSRMKPSPGYADATIGFRCATSRRVRA